MREGLLVFGVLKGDELLEITGFEYKKCPLILNKSKTRIPLPVIHGWRNREISKQVDFPVYQFCKENEYEIRDEAVGIVNARLNVWDAKETLTAIFSFGISPVGHRWDVVGVKDNLQLEIASNLVYHSSKDNSCLSLHIWTGNTLDISTKAENIMFAGQ